MLGILELQILYTDHTITVMIYIRDFLDPSAKLLEMDRNEIEHSSKTDYKLYIH